MTHPQTESRLTLRVIESLYVEAMLLADEARGYFDQFGMIERERLDPLQRVTFTCESLKVTTRLMHIVAWLLSIKARSSGEQWARADLDLRLGRAATSQADEVAELPAAAAQLVLTSVDLYDRVARLHDRVRRDQSPAGTPVHALHARLAQQL